MFGINEGFKGAPKTLEIYPIGFGAMMELAHFS